MPQLSGELRFVMQSHEQFGQARHFVVIRRHAQRNGVWHLREAADVGHEAGTAGRQRPQQRRRRFSPNRISQLHADVCGTTEAPEILERHASRKPDAMVDPETGCQSFQL